MIKIKRLVYIISLLLVVMVVGYLFYTGNQLPPN